MKLEAWITWELRDKNGQLTSFEKVRANSIVRSFIDILYAAMSQSTFTNGGIDTSGATKSPSAYLTNFAANGALANASMGLVVGRGAATVGVGDTSLVNQILNGNGQYQLAHGTTTFTSPTTSGSTRSFTIQRTFTNNYSAPLTVTEVGIYIESAGSQYFMMDHTVTSKTINNGTSGTLTYTLGVTV